ncbi:class I SAM-dependent methyltransferase [Natrialba asiatica]|uniref:Methyltransferase type 11 n=1 Tax=Natrialba asiatica (strain ATCC 700177 / DSM 12278 / JCM 9576 / FERM P-10747 / NBRC 102637 / 172P1) TaxID=29540 RepID=M0AZZ3_NATA1|nr:class I SAM-dependent methyltransferase [Natrialba asiatica]ELZ03518.1 methyltransferase type 11 [Natrialba asiatica DSM 12278]
MVDKTAVRRGYDELAETYAAERAASEGGRERDVLTTVLRSLETPGRVLDAGCGQGTPVLRDLDGDGPRNGDGNGSRDGDGNTDENGTRDAIGIDVSRAQLELAAENAPTASLSQGDMTRLPFRDDCCDAVTALHSLIHVPLADHRAVIDEFSRVLRPGGRVLVSEGAREWTGTNPDWLDSGVEMQWHIAGIEATREQLRAAGFTITDEWGTTEPFADQDEHWRYLAAELDAERAASEPPTTRHSE